MSGDSHRRVDHFIEFFGESHPAFAKEILRTREREPELFWELAPPMLEWAETCLGTDYAKQLTHGYVRFVMALHKSQQAYEACGRYENTSSETAFREVYDNPEYMNAYHWGVYTTTFTWGHHLRLYGFFRDQFLRRLPETDFHVLDLGAGSGIWHLIALSRSVNCSATAVDFSPTAFSWCQRLGQATGFAARIDYRQSDALSIELDRPCTGVISNCLLEHVEHPARLMENVARNLEMRSYAYIVGALTSAEPDHIREFRNESELVQLAENAGLRLVASLCESPTNADADMHFLPRSMAMVLQKRRNEIW